MNDFEPHRAESAAPASEAAALAGITVIDLTTIVFGPYATQTLADYGADVVKIEAPGGDSTRHTGPSQEPGMASLFLGSNRNKRSVVLDLKHADGRAALLALVDRADVFIHNIRPQKLAGLGLSAAALRQRNPRLVYVGLHGFGEDGPYAGRPAYDDIVQSLSGAADLMRRQSGAPAYFPTITADKTSGQMAVHAVLAALFQRERTGRGQVIEVPMFEATTAFLLTEHLYARHLAERDQGQPGAEGDFGYPRTLAAWRRPYRTLDGHVCVMPYTDDNWRCFFEASDRPALAADPRFADIGMRTRYIAELYAIAGDIVATRSTDEWLALCERLQIPCAPVNRLEDLENDPHLRAVGLFADVTSDTGRHYRFVRNPVKLGDSHVAPAPAPRLGQHTAEVLGEAGLPGDLIGRILAGSAE